MLADLQAAMRRSLLAIEGDRPAGIVADGIPAAARFDIYRRSVVMSLEQCLADAFPATERLLDPCWFRPAARAFARHFPPALPQLSAYGEGFPAFLAANGALEVHEAAVDLAQLEWARMSAYFAADAPSLDLDRLARLAPADTPALRFGMHPSFRLQPLLRPVPAVLSLLSEWGSMIPPPGAQDRFVGSFVLRARRGVLLGFADSGEFALMSALSAGSALGAAADLAWAEDRAIDLQAVLSRHFQLGSFSVLH